MKNQWGDSWFETIWEAAEQLNAESVVVADGRIIEQLLDYAPVKISDANNFTGSLKHIDGISRVIKKRIEKSDDNLRKDPHISKLLLAHKLCAYKGDYDFSHTIPDWDVIMSLGLLGLLSRLQSAMEKATTQAQKEYYDAGVRVYQAAIRYVCRMAQKAAEMGKTDMANGLFGLTKRPPQTLYEAMQLTFLYYDFQRRVEQTPVRSLGRLDLLYAPYLEADLAAGRLTEKSAKELIDQFFIEWDNRRVGSNIPFAIGGVLDGKLQISKLSYWLLERHVALNLPNVKVHIFYDERVPEDFIRMAMQGIRSGSNSIVFLNDREIKKSLKGLNIDSDDAEHYQVVGCYEPCGCGEVPCSCNGMINLAKTVELALFAGKDLLTGEQIAEKTKLDFEKFEDFLQAFYMQLHFSCHSCMELINAREACYPQIHSAPFFSATYHSCVQKGGDVYCDSAAKYNNSSINLVGLANAVDALMSIKKLVFEDREMTLDDFRKILQSNWENNELLRVRIIRTFPKYGIADIESDQLARQIVASASKEINGRPNVKGGVFRLGGFSINWRFFLGDSTGASADGRKAGEPISKNLCAVTGVDREGVTGQLLSASSLDGINMPNGSVLDLVLHSSAVCGQNGLTALCTTLRIFMSRGGMSIQYSVLDSDILRNAQTNPESYPNLQVRLCGWNVLFSRLSKQEQDEFISKAEANS